MDSQKGTGPFFYRLFSRQKKGLVPFFIGFSADKKRHLIDLFARFGGGDFYCNGKSRSFLKRYLSK